MIKNYIKIAWRNIARNKVNSFINIAGLAIGMACVILILLYVQDEVQYDRFFKDANRIYQVNLNGKMGGEEFLTSNTPPPVGKSLVDAFPEIETYTRIYRPGDVVVRSGEKGAENFFAERKVFGVDSNFLQVFDYRLLKGSAATCLLQPNSVVVTETIAKKYFGNAEAIGKIVLLDDDRKPFVVTGVLRDLPAQSTFDFDVLRPMASYPVVKRFNWSWVWLQVDTYVKLRSNTPSDAAAIQTLQAKFPAMVQQQAATAFQRIGQPLDELKKKGGKWDLQLQPFTSIHLYSAAVNGRHTTLSDIKYVRIFSFIALFIIILACVNFMNLSTAQSAKRAKEVGIRKVLGSVRGQLVKQFLSEAFVYSISASVIALLLVIILLQPFNSLSGKELSLHLLSTPWFWSLFVALVLLTGVVAGSYPAFYLTSFKPVAVLKGKLARTSIGSLFIRNGLVVFQFTVSTALIICTMIVFQQLQYTRSKNLGLDKGNVIVIANSNRLAQNEEAFKNAISAFPEVAGASISTSVPTKFLFGDMYVPEPAAGQQVAKDLSLSSFMVDDDFVPTLALQMADGRNFSKEFNDSASVILNEAAVQQIGWTNAVGQFLQYPGNGNQRFKVIGVVKDFNVASFRAEVEPFALFHSSSKTYDLGKSTVIAKVKGDDLSGTIAKIEKEWKSLTPDTPFDYSFLDTDFEALYDSDKRMGTVFGLFTFLSIFVGCLGLFGLAAYTAERRTKEIGIRKVLGASVQGLVALLSKDFIRLIVIAFVIASPLAWYFMNKWLQDFAYRINIEWWVFAAAALIALVIAFFTISSQAIKAAVANPVKSLRTE